MHNIPAWLFLLADFRETEYLTLCERTQKCTWPMPFWTGPRNNYKPHCSLMAYVPGDSGERLFLVTSSASRKYQNIRRHPRVSLLIDTRGEQQSEFTQAVTVTGTCDILQDTAKIAQIKADFVRQHPHLEDFIRKDDIAVMCVQVDFFLLLEGPERRHSSNLRVGDVLDLWRVVDTSRRIDFFCGRNEGSGGRSVGMSCSSRIWQPGTAGDDVALFTAGISWSCILVRITANSRLAFQGNFTAAFSQKRR
ncbi:MAG: pyridoxamine 5'-phosphate oxidase family protein [Desulfobacterales bacterium]